LGGSDLRRGLGESRHPAGAPWGGGLSTYDLDLIAKPPPGAAVERSVAGACGAGLVAARAASRRARIFVTRLSTRAWASCDT
jgi:hypothetical protein